MIKKREIGCWNLNEEECLHKVINAAVNFYDCVTKHSNESFAEAVNLTNLLQKRISPN